MRTLVALIVLLGLVPGSSLAQITWSPEFYDPASVAAPTEPADLALPLPCGGAMAFQRVEVPVDSGNPLSDRSVPLGQTRIETAFSEFLHTEYLRGPFGDGSLGQSHYFIARYELTVGQYRALTGDCRDPERTDRIAKGGLSWFDAVALGQKYTEWLHANASSELPRQGESLAFVRLPTEAEWEYAVRGGTRVDESMFRARHFFGDGNLRDYATIQAPGSGRGRMAPVGIRAPNPLGLYDVYGNAEELMLEPYRLNAGGRAHGQAGGLVTRGGSFHSAEQQVYSAQRIEYPFFSTSTGTALSPDTFGVRFVLSAAVTSSDAFLDEVSEGWKEMARRETSEEQGDAGRLSTMPEGEPDLEQAAALEALQSDLRNSLASAKSALGQAARSTMLAGAISIESLNSDALRIQRHRTNILMLSELARVSRPDSRERMRIMIEDLAKQSADLRSRQRNLLLTYRSSLDILAKEIGEADRDAAYALLRVELELSGQTSALALLVRFWDDLDAYLAKPDMSLNEVLNLALSE